MTVIKPVSINAVATYLGCAGVVLGSLGLASQSAVPRSAQANVPLFMRTGAVAAPIAVRPPPLEQTAVAFLDENLRLLTPTKIEPAKTASASGAEAAQASPPGATSEAKGSVKETVRETKRSKSRRAARSRQREPIDDGYSSYARDDGYRYDRGQRYDEIDRAPARQRDGSARYHVERDPGGGRVFGPFFGGW